MEKAIVPKIQERKIRCGRAIGLLIRHYINGCALTLKIRTLANIASDQVLGVEAFTGLIKAGNIKEVVWIGFVFVSLVTKNMIQKPNITCFTSVTGAKDGVREMLDIKRASAAKFVAFLETPLLSPTWEVRPAYNRFMDLRRNSRIQKMLPHQYFDTEYSIYIDGNIKLLDTPENLIAKHLKDYDIAVYKHPTRDCIYDEAIACAKRGLDDPEVIIEQVKGYEDRGYAKHKGLAECGIILRRHTPQVTAFNNAWWAEYCRHSKRDQISFMYAADQTGIPVNIVTNYFVGEMRQIKGVTVEAGVRKGEFDIIPHNIAT
jgi:hypothetical protein